jgi:hypothetical protein
MTSFRVVQSRESGRKGWAVERFEPDGVAMVVTRVYATKGDADREADKLNDAVARRTMR